MKMPRRFGLGTGFCVHYGGIRRAPSLTVMRLQSNTEPMHYESNMTVKGQITVPQDIRDALGLKPGDAVEFVLDEDGNARIVRADDAARIEARKDAFLNRVKEVRAKFKPLDTMADSGMDGLAYQRFMRDGPEV